MKNFSISKRYKNTNKFIQKNTLITISLKEGLKEPNTVSLLLGILLYKSKILNMPPHQSLGTFFVPSD